MLFQKNHLSLAIHCLVADGEEKPNFNNQLFISVSELEDLIIYLKNNGYVFDLLRNITDSDQRTCSITFDDGYYNNRLFLQLAEKHKIPFILFVSAYNIIESSYYLWDLLDGNANWSWNKDSYSYLYKGIDVDNKRFEGKEKHYRPMSLEELKRLAGHDYVYLGNHSYSHTPFSKSYKENLDFELTACSKIFGGQEYYLDRELALPCGLLSMSHKSELEKRFDRIYTVTGGLNSINQKMIDRVSLENPEVRGPLIEQVERGCRFFMRTKRRLSIFRDSNF